MKKIILGLFLLLLLNQLGHAQLGQMTSTDAPLIKKSKTYFVLDDDDSTLYNKSLIAAAKKFWKISEYDFIKFAQVNEYVQKTNTTFIFKLVFGVNTGTQGAWSYTFNPSTQSYGKTFSQSGSSLIYSYDGLVLVFGEKKKPFFSWNDWLSFCLLTDIENVERYNFNVGAYLQIIQNFVNYMEKSGEKGVNLGKAKELYNANKGKLKSKTLYINRMDLPDEINSVEKIKEVYKYDVKVVGPNEIKAAIDNKDEKVAILNNSITGGGARGYTYIFEANGGDLLYFDMDKAYQVNPTKSIKKMLKDVSTISK